MIHAAKFDSSGNAVKLMAGSAHFLNINLGQGETWREIAQTVTTLQDVPSLETLPAHEDLVEPT